MNKQREALQVALEALEDYQANGAPFFKCDSAVSAIREALAEPEQKPVAVVTSQTGDPAMTMSWHHEPALPIGTKLYTAPPARKPLTDEQIDAEFDRECWVTVVFADGTKGIALDKVTARDFARAIERAHGIGEA